MKKFIARRIVYMLFTLFVITAATFFLMHSIPGDPLSYMARNLPEQTRANYYAKYGLDKPVFDQFVIFLKGLLTEGSLGESLRYPGRDVTQSLFTYSSVSVVPGGLALLLGLIIGVLLGLVGLAVQPGEGDLVGVAFHVFSFLSVSVCAYYRRFGIIARP